ncbi:MAG: tetratricopeptide repeat protein [Desulfobacterium sp.]|nr:tetratricopeptide repeat protein [Desulfobacterium sp.]MBU3949466.1 tetratricopeptide repeat protein [Pseudomonadota bacterium]MBU4035001.1 tetratricopeptide repeat protein [Pseudomonadota bacterium]
MKTRYFLRIARCFIIGFLSFLIICMYNPVVYGTNCEKCDERGDGTIECSAIQVDMEIDNVDKQVVDQFRLIGPDYVDVNENQEILSLYLDTMNRIGQSVKERVFSEKIETGGLETREWLNTSVIRIRKAQAKYPESRHLTEGLARIYGELYEVTDDIVYLRKSAEAYITAEEIGTKYHDQPVSIPHYYVEVAYSLSLLGERGLLDTYFSRMLELFSHNGDIPLQYARALARLNDYRADQFYVKSMSMRNEGDINAVVYYGEYLLDRKKDRQALSVLYQLKPSEDRAFYPHFLKGVALERLGRLDEAQNEYKRYLGFRENGADITMDSKMFQVPNRYKIQGSTLQGDIPFSLDVSDIEGSGAQQATDVRATPNCGSTDWACKARYYMVWTINGEAEKAGAYGPGTIGMMRAVGWNIRTRVIRKSGYRVCYGATQYCFNYASNYTFTVGDVNSLHKRYYYVMDSGGYAGLPIGQYTPTSEAVYYDVFNGRVPDPIAGACVYGFMSGDTCNGTCSGQGLWDSFSTSSSGPEFRAGRLTWVNEPVWPFTSCWEFTPMSSPSGVTCGIDCWKEKGVICPVIKQITSGSQCYSSTRGYYWYKGPVYGNIFWSFKTQ